MRIATTLCIPLLLAALVAAQGGATADDLVRKLNHDDYEVREDATKKLIALGAAAVPALEKALKSDDLEVRLRAGRALRAIRGEDNTREAEDGEDDVAPAPRPLRPGATQSSVSMKMTPDGVEVTVTEVVDGKQQSKTYKGKTLDELVKKHPELKRHVGGVRVRTGRDPFNMDDFWRQWNKDADEHFRRLRQDTARDMERLRRLMEAMRQGRDPLDGALRPSAAGRLLGMRASKPDPVLNAQLQLRGRGLVVHAVEKDSLAERLGIQKYDVLLSLDGRNINRAEDVAQVLRARKEGEPLKAVVLRAAREVELETAG